MFGLIGYPLGHSFSKDFFTKKFLREQIIDEEYKNFPIKDILEFPSVVEENPNLKGLNVTIPYKEKIIPFLHQIDPVASEIGAVNTIRFYLEGNKRLMIGYNTDSYGFNRSLDEILPNGLNINSALILGTGGASKAIAYSLKKRDIPFLFVSRGANSSLNYSGLSPEIIRNNQLIINTTPVGMYPNVNEFPDIPYEFLTSSHILFDLVYNPYLTQFLAKGQEQGATICNGLKMLEYQALKSWEIWNNV